MKTDVPTAEEAAEELRAFMKAREISIEGPEGLPNLLRKKGLFFSTRTIYRWLANPQKGADRLKMLAMALRLIDEAEKDLAASGAAAA